MKWARNSYCARDAPIIHVSFTALMQAKCSKAMQSFREQLPAYKVKADFLKAVADNQVYFAIWIK